MNPYLHAIKSAEQGRTNIYNLNYSTIVKINEQ